MTRARPTIRLLLGPGTLPAQGLDRLDLLRYAPFVSGRPALSGQELLTAIPEIATQANVVVDDDNPHPIATYEDLRRLALRAAELLRRPDVDGLVHVQGTNSIEETAYFFNLVLRTEKPVVVTGAQRPFTALSSDGALNLYNAIRVAAAEEARSMGVLVVANDEINAARDVTKTNTYRLHAFRSRDLGILGYADADRVVFYRKPTRRHTSATAFDLSGISRMPAVDVIYAHVGARPGLARAAVNQGAEGLVVAGTGAGSAAELRKELATIAAAGIPVVRSARVGEGRVIRDDNWQEPGMIAADTLNPQKAAILLSLALTRTRDADEIQRLFDEY